MNIQPPTMKPFSALLILLITISFYSCKQYKKVAFTNHSPFEHHKLRSHFNSYNVYVKDSTTVYRVRRPHIEESFVSGVYEEVSPREKEAVLNQEQINDQSDHKYDIVISTNKDMRSLVDSLQNSSNAEASLESAPTFATDIITEDQAVSLHKEDIENVSVYAFGEGLGSVVLLIVAGTIALFLIMLIIVVIVNLSSGGSSGGNGGACYVATMVYGSYDAPEVMTLRRFRDGFLKQHQYGRKFIYFYYKHSPKFVEKHRDKTYIHKPIRWMLNIFVGILRTIYH